MKVWRTCFQSGEPPQIKSDYRAEASQKRGGARWQPAGRVIIRAHRAKPSPLALKRIEDLLVDLGENG